MTGEEHERRARGRALLAYSAKGQKEFAQAAGIKYDRLREVVRPGGRDVPTLDELVAMCEAAEVPTPFALGGWRVADPVAQLADQINELRAQQAEDAVRLAQLEEAVQEMGATGRPAKGAEGNR